MKQFLLYLLLVVIGGILGGTAIVVGDFHEKPAEIWTSTRSISTDNGIVIPEGVEMRVYQYGPEGLVTLQLYLNVDDQAVGYFSQETDSRSNLIIPYQVKQ